MPLLMIDLCCICDEIFCYICVYYKAFLRVAAGGLRLTFHITFRAERSLIWFWGNCCVKETLKKKEEKKKDVHTAIWCSRKCGGLAQKRGGGTLGTMGNWNMGWAQANVSRKCGTYTKTRCTKSFSLTSCLSIYLSFSVSHSFLASYLSCDVKFKLDEAAGKAAASNYKADEVAF